MWRKVIGTRSLMSEFHSFLTFLEAASLLSSQTIQGMLEVFLELNCLKPPFGYQEAAKVSFS